MSRTFMRKLSVGLATFLFLVTTQLVSGQGKGKKPPNPGSGDRTLYEVRLVPDIDWTDGPSQEARLLTGVYGTADVPNDCESSFWINFNLRAPDAIIPDSVPFPPIYEDRLLLPGIDGKPDTDDDVEILVYFDGSGTSSQVNIYIGKSTPEFIDSVGVFFTSYVEQEPHETEPAEALFLEHACPIADDGTTTQLITLHVHQEFEARTKKGKKPVGTIAIGDIEFELGPAG